MRGIVMGAKQRRGTLVVSTLVGGVLFRLGDAQAADPTYRFDIPREPLSQALTDFSQAAAQQIIYSESVVQGRTTRGLHGSYTVAEAIRALLNGTDLRADVNSSGVLMIREKTAVNTRAEPPANTSPAPIQHISYQAVQSE